LDSNERSPCLRIRVIIPLSMEVGSFPSCMLVCGTGSRSEASSLQNYFYKSYVSPSSLGDIPEFEFWRAVLNSIMVRDASHFSNPSWLSSIRWRRCHPLRLVCFRLYC
jgi:hypothetical protein